MAGLRPSGAMVGRAPLGPGWLRPAMGARARDLYRAFVDAGQGGLDFSGVIRMIEGAGDAR